MLLGLNDFLLILVYTAVEWFKTNSNAGNKTSDTGWFVGRFNSDDLH